MATPSTSVSTYSLHSFSSCHDSLSDPFRPVSLPPFMCLVWPHLSFRLALPCTYFPFCLFTLRHIFCLHILLPHFYCFCIKAWKHMPIFVHAVAVLPTGEICIHTHASCSPLTTHAHARFADNMPETVTTVATWLPSFSFTSSSPSLHVTFC